MKSYTPYEILLSLQLVIKSSEYSTNHGKDYAIFCRVEPFLSLLYLCIIGPPVASSLRQTGNRPQRDAVQYYNHKCISKEQNPLMQ